MSREESEVIKTTSDSDSFNYYCYYYNYYYYYYYCIFCILLVKDLIWSKLDLFLSEVCVHALYMPKDSALSVFSVYSVP